MEVPLLVVTTVCQLRLFRGTTKFKVLTEVDCQSLVNTAIYEEISVTN